MPPTNASNRELIDLGLTVGSNNKIWAGAQMQLDHGGWDIEDTESELGTYSTADITTAAGTCYSFTVAITKSATLDESDVTAMVAGDTGAGYSYITANAAFWYIRSCRS